jgi:hypothetical protein
MFADFTSITRINATITVSGVKAYFGMRGASGPDSIIGSAPCGRWGCDRLPSSVLFYVVIEYPASLPEYGETDDT